MEKNKILPQREVKKYSIDKCCPKKRANENKRKWEKPSLEDVSGKVMAQPYIRFT
jgi:hypothetical protein